MNIDPSLSATRPFPPPHFIFPFLIFYLIFLLFPFSYFNPLQFLRTQCRNWFSKFLRSLRIWPRKGERWSESLILSLLPWVFFLGWRSFQGGKDSPRTSELDPIFTFSTFCCHPIRWQGERWSCVAWNESLATLPRLCIPRGNLDPNRRTRIHDCDPSFEFFLFI